jgi:mannosyltransferase OCH1-like enzyme
MKFASRAKLIFKGKLDRARVLYPRSMAKLLRELPAFRLEDRARLKSWHHSIVPGVLYQTSETGLLGRTHYREIQNFRNLNPDINFEFYDRERRDQYMREHWHGHPLADIYFRSLFGQVNADIFRYCILWQRGGIYCDIKSRFLVPVSELLEARAQVVIAYEDRYANVAPPSTAVNWLQDAHRLALQWALIFAPQHPLLLNVLDSIVHVAPMLEGVAFADPQAAICRFTGPGRFTQALWSWLGAESEPQGLQQAGIDFSGRAEYNMPGAWSRWALHPHYSLAKHRSILAKEMA